MRALEERLTKGTKGLIGNKGYRKYVKMEKDAVSIDENKVATEARYDGKWVLTTNTALKPEARCKTVQKPLDGGAGVQDDEIRPQHTAHLS